MRKAMNSTPLRERRVKATKQKLDALMKSDAELKAFLTTPISRLPKEYKYLIAAADQKTDKNETLYDAAMICLKEYTVSEFSMVGNKVVGFMSYFVVKFWCPPRIADIAMFSCDPKSNGAVLMRDMQNLIKELQRYYASIEWSAYPDNPANRIYQRLANMERGKFGVDPSFPDFIRYRIPGTMPLPENTYLNEKTGYWEEIV